MTIDRWPLIRRSTGWGTGQSVRRGWEFKKPPPRFISHIFSSRACHPFTSLLPKAILDWLKAWTCFWDEFELGLGFETQGFSLWEHLLSALRASGLFQLLLRAPRASGLWLLLLVSFSSLFGLLLLFVSLDGTPKRDGHLQGSGQAPCRAISAQAGGSSPKGEVWHCTLQFEWWLSALQAKICLEESSYREKY